MVTVWVAKPPNRGRPFKAGALNPGPPARNYPLAGPNKLPRFPPQNDIKLTIRSYQGFPPFERPLNEFRSGLAGPSHSPSHSPSRTTGFRMCSVFCCLTSDLLLKLTNIGPGFNPERRRSEEQPLHGVEHTARGRWEGPPSGAARRPSSNMRGSGRPLRQSPGVTGPDKFFGLLRTKSSIWVVPQ